MNKKIFLCQAIILLVKGLVPLITFYVLDKLTTVEYFSAILICISLSNLVANLSNLSSNTMAPIYFQSNSEADDSRYFFQSIRLIIGFVLIAIACLYLVLYSELNYSVYISILLFQFSLSILPIWHYYLLNKVELILFYETLVRIPIYISLYLSYYYANLDWLFRAYYFVALVVVFFNVYYLIFYKKVYVEFTKNKVASAVNYIVNVLPYNFIVCIINSGFVFLSGNFLKPEVLVQISFAERIKMILLQFNGALLMAKLPSNSLLLKHERVNKSRKFIYKNFDFIITVCVVTLMFIFSISFFSGILSQFFGSYSKEYLYYYILILLVAPVSSFAALLLNHFLMPVKKPFFLRKVIKVQLMMLLFIILLFFIGDIDFVIIALPLFIEVTVFLFLVFTMFNLDRKTRAC